MQPLRRFSTSGVLLLVCSSSVRFGSESSILAHILITCSSGDLVRGSFMKPQRRRGAKTFANYRPLSNPLTGVDCGSYASIEIARFTMAVGGNHIENDSGAIIMVAHNAMYYVYYDDPDLSAKGHVAYMATTQKVTGIAGRFFVGSIATPTKGGSPTRGNDDGGWGEYRSFAELGGAGGNAPERRTPFIGEHPPEVKNLSTKHEMKRRVRSIWPPKKAKPIELKRLKRIRVVIDQGLRGIRYCKELDRDGVNPKRDWLADGCPNSYVLAYADKKWRKKIQHEKWRVSKMSGLQA